jgi:hypothetical protein
MANAQLSDLTGAAGYGVLMALGTRRRVKHGT